MKLVIGMTSDHKTDAQPTDGEKRKNINPEQISDEKENQNAEKKERCNPCMHCGVHCIFLKEE